MFNVLAGREKRTPAHDEGSTNSSRGVLSSVDRDSGTLCAHTNTKENTADEKLGPSLGAGSTKDRPEAEVGSSENSSYGEMISTMRPSSKARFDNSTKLTTTTEVEVQRIREPAANESERIQVSR